ncbi:MAG: DUF2079 domain-containing protein [Gemmatimonadota bacterium]
MAAWTWHFTRISLEVHHGFGTSAYDLGLYVQGMWLLSQFQTPFVTLMGRHLFGDHTSFILLLLVPLYWVAPSADTLLTAQSAVIAMGAIPVFLYARHRLESSGLGFLFGAVYLAHPAVGWTNLENFHPDSFLGFFIGMAVWAALSRHWRTYAAFVVLALLVKEDVSLVVVPLGIWVALQRDRRIGLMTIVGSLGYMAFAMFVVMRSLIGVPTRNLWRIPFGGITGLITTTIYRPAELLAHLRSDGRPWYIWQMLFPSGWTAFRLPDVAAISGLVLFTNVLSTFWYQHQIQYHYALVAVPALTLGAVHAIGASCGLRRRVVVGAVALTALWSSILWGPLPWSRNELAHWAPSHPGAQAARRIVMQVPEEAVLSAHHLVASHLANRSLIYMFPNPFRVILYGPDDRLAGRRLEPQARQVQYVVLPVNRTEIEAGDWAAIESAFTRVSANEYWELYRRDAPLPEPPPAGE